MKTEYLPRFLKDLKRLKGTPAYDTVVALVFEQFPGAASLADIPHLKKIRQKGDFYRVRIGDYRVGFRLDGDLCASCTGKTSTATFHRHESGLSFPFITQYAHIHEINVGAIAPDMCAQPPFLHESARLVRVDGARWCRLPSARRDEDF